MSELQWENRSLRDLGYGIEDESIDPVDLVNYFLEKIERDKNGETIFLNVLNKKATEEAKDAATRAKKGQRHSLYDGIPLAWKDNIDIQGESTSAGLPILAQTKASRNAEAYSVALDAGMICIGKTNMTELAFSGLGINPNYGTPINPYSGKHPCVPGGSSSGSAISVAKGLCCAGIGTDTGGSIRTPAAWNGLVGLKTTAKLISTKGVVPLSQTLDTVGFLTKTVIDSATLLEIFTKTETVELSDSNCNGLNLIVCANEVWDEIDTGVNEIMHNALENLSQDGANIKWKEIPEIGEVLDLVNTYGNIVSYEGNKNWGQFLAENPSAISADILARFHLGAKIKDNAISHVYTSMEVIKEKYRSRTSGCNAVVMPTVSTVPPVIAELEADGDLYARQNFLSLRNTRLANLLGLCSISIPAGLTTSGFPVGIMLVSGPFSESDLLRTAAAVEKCMISHKVFS